MIDIDKYEGYSEDEWILVDDEYIVMNNKTGNVAKFDSLQVKISQPDMNLMLDAPLLLAEVKRLRKEINQLPIDLHESLDMILEAHYPEVRESVMSMFGDAWGNYLTGYEE